MAVNLLRWPNRLRQRLAVRAARCSADLRAGLARYPPTASTVRTNIAFAYDKIQQALVSQLISAAVLGFVWLFWGIFEPLSIWFFVEFSFIIFMWACVSSKHYKGAASASLGLLAIIVSLSLTANYQISSDQFRFRYKVINNVSYFEFPGQLRVLGDVTRSLGRNNLINVVECDGTKVAVLPLLPFKPLFLENSIIDRVGFRRLPFLEVENIELNIGASVDGPSTNAPHGTFGLKFGFGAAQKSLLLTRIFPRSLKCKEHGVPLLPVLEVLPWNPDDADSLIETATAVAKLRELSPAHPISLDMVRQVHKYQDAGAYSALLDFVAYSLIYQMFDGNIFEQTRAHLGNTLCTLIDSNPSIFSDAAKGPFSAFSDNLIRQMAAEFGSKVRLVTPACHIPEELIQAYETLPSATSELPFDATFRTCLDSKSSMAECLAKDDAPPARPTCEGIACNTPTPPALSDEIVLEDYDQKRFSTVVATKENTLVDVISIEPRKCPELRDESEDQYFIDWWINHANAFANEPAQCSSMAWRMKYAQSRKELHDSLSCAATKNIRGPQYTDDGADILDLLLSTKCSGTFDVASDRLITQMYKFGSQLELLIDQLQRYSTLMEDSESQALIGALKMFEKIKRDACGTRDIESCVDEYKVWHDYQRLISKIADDLNLSNLGSGQAAIIDALTKLDNVIIDMAICDALQDAGFSEHSGYDRATYCDAHGLEKYRLIGSTSVGHSIERTNDRTGVVYQFESDGTGKQFGIKKFLDK